MSRLRVAAFVAGGPIALRALDAVAAEHEVVVIVRARPARPLWQAWRGVAAAAARALRLRPVDPVTVWAAGAGVPIILSAAGAEARTASLIRATRPDVGCIATYPRRIPDALLAATGAACVNLHPSLLPRHRGASPLFWTYHAGDTHGGVTVHLATPRLDAGGILLQERFAIGRGEPALDVHARSAAAGGPLLARALALLGAGATAAVEQDERAATQAPSPVAGRSYCDLAAWTSARAWHFLAGLSAGYREPFVDPSGRPVRYQQVHGYEVCEPRWPPGTVVRDGAGWYASARDGVVHLS